MATQDTTVEVLNGEEIDDEVETLNSEDETSQEINQDVDETDTGTESDDSDDEDGEQETDTETKEEEEKKFQKRFTQLKGETLEEYVASLEEAYRNSSTEGQRLASEGKEFKTKYEQMAQLVATNPEFAKAVQEATAENAPKPQVDPALEYAREQMNRQFESDYNSFVDKHPQMATDETLRQRVTEEVEVISFAAQQRGVRLTMEQALNKAWVSLGETDNTSKEDVVNKVKEQASKPAAQAKAKTGKQKQSFTDEQIAVAKKMGLTPEQLAQYNK